MYLLISFLILLIVFALFVASRPSEFTVCRTTLIKASASSVFAQINELKKWQLWSPWAKLDPEATNIYEGPMAGKGALMRWNGNNKIGSGNMSIIESLPNDLIRFQLEFIKPFAAINIAEFKFEPKGDQTQLTWSMVGRNDFIGKAIGLFLNCDQMVGSQFEQGLESLRLLVEKNQ